MRILQKRTKSNKEKLNEYEIKIKENRLKTSKEKIINNLTTQIYSKKSNSIINYENDDKVFNIKSNLDFKDSMIKPKSFMSQSNYDNLNSQRQIKTYSGQRIKTFSLIKKLNCT